MTLLPCMHESIRPRMGGLTDLVFGICLISLTLGTSDSLVTFSGTAFLCTSTKERGHVHFFFFIAC